MKEQGAKFRLNGTEIHELTNYYILKNNVNIYRENGMLTIDKNIMLNTINEIIQDLDKYYDDIVVIHYIIDRKDGGEENNLSKNVEEFITNLNIRYN